MSENTDSTRSAAEEAEDAAAVPLDLLLADAATSMLRRVGPSGSGLRLAAALGARPPPVPRGGEREGGERLRRTLQPDLAAAETAEALVSEAELEEADAERVGFVLTNLIDALSPSNN